jgi:hypothetical protein
MRTASHHEFKGEPGSIIFGQRRQLGGSRGGTAGEQVSGGRGGEGGGVWVRARPSCSHDTGLRAQNSRDGWWGRRGHGRGLRRVKLFGLCGQVTLVHDQYAVGGAEWA